MSNSPENPPLPPGKTRAPGKTVYFLGAGFSAAAGLPTMPHFVSKSFRLLKRYASPDLTNKFAGIVTEYRRIAASTGIDIDDIQELFSLASGSHSKQSGGSNEDHIRCIRAVIAHTICFSHLEDKRLIERINSAPKTELESPDISLMADEIGRSKMFDYWYKRDNCEDTWAGRTVPKRHLFPPNEKAFLYDEAARQNQPPKKCVGNLLNHCVYEAFLSYVLHRSRFFKVEIGQEKAGPYYEDVIITPNYDLVIEKALESLNNGEMTPESAKYPCRIDYGTSFEPESSEGAGKYPRLKLVKLHGSLNWKFSKEIQKWQKFPTLEEPSLFTTEADKFFETYGKLPLIPPTWQRHDHENGSTNGNLFDQLREEARAQLETAERIVIIGYSMPKTDLHIKYLLAHALITPDPPTIEVWDVKPYAEMQAAIETMFGQELAKGIRKNYHPNPENNTDSASGLLSFVRSHPFKSP